jgi:hypothetical protein
MARDRAGVRPLLYDPHLAIALPRGEGAAEVPGVTAELTHRLIRCHLLVSAGPRTPFC